MSVPLYLLRACMEAARACQETDSDEVTEALERMLAAMQRAEPVQIVRVLTDAEAVAYLRHGFDS